MYTSQVGKPQPGRPLCAIVAIFPRAFRDLAGQYPPEVLLPRRRFERAVGRAADALRAMPASPPRTARSCRHRRRLARTCRVRHANLYDACSLRAGPARLARSSRASPSASSLLYGFVDLRLLSAGNGCMRWVRDCGDCVEIHVLIPPLVCIAHVQRSLFCVKARLRRTGRRHTSRVVLL